MKTGFLHRDFWFTITFSSILALTLSCSTVQQDREIDVVVDSQFPVTSLSSTDYAYQQLIQGGISPAFADSIKKSFQTNYSSADRDRIIQMNVLGFLNPSDHSRHFTPKAVNHIKKFVKKYGKTLRKAEEQYSVPKEVIASLLWVETRHGKSTGDFKLPAVFFSLMQASHPQIAKNTLNELNDRRPSSSSAAASLSKSELQQKVAQRLLSKSKWAVEQIKAMESISILSLPPHHLPGIMTIRSSFAGAFGCSQFIPSSYIKYSVSSNESNSPNLFDLRDCILSVGNYLKMSGWNPNNPQSWSDALFEYNRVRDYGDVILKLANAAKS